MTAIKFFDDYSYLYIESYNDIGTLCELSKTKFLICRIKRQFIVTDNIYNGKLIYLNNENSVMEKLTYEGYRTRFLIGMVLPHGGENCLVSIYHNNEFAHIYCEQQNVNGLVLKQILSTGNARMVKVAISSFFVSNQLTFLFFFRQVLLTSTALYM